MNPFCHGIPEHILTVSCLGKISVPPIIPPPVKSSHPLDEHWEKEHIHKDQRGPEMKVSEEGIHVPPGNLREPVIEACEESKENPWCNHVVEVPNHVVGVVQMEINKVEG